MAGFNAATAVERLDFDFTAFNGPKGVIPEPSTKQVKAFFNELRDVGLAVRRRQQEMEDRANSENEADVSDDEAMESLISASEAEAEQYNERVFEAVVQVCGNAFTVEDLHNLPYRVNQAFMVWLRDAIRPEGQTPAGSR